MKNISRAYLIFELLSLVSYIIFYKYYNVNTGRLFAYFFIISVPFYLACGTFLIYVHPVVCLFIMIDKNIQLKKRRIALIHFIISLVFSFIFTYILFIKGYIFSQ